MDSASAYCSVRYPSLDTVAYHKRRDRPIPVNMEMDPIRMILAWTKSMCAS